MFNYQDIHINLLDADTKEILRHDFNVICTGDGAIGYAPRFRRIYNGQAAFYNLLPSDVFMINFEVFGDQFTKIGYDPVSIDGNIVAATTEVLKVTDPTGGWEFNYTFNYLPRVINIHVSKLK